MHIYLYYILRFLGLYPTLEGHTRSQLTKWHYHKGWKVPGLIWIPQSDRTFGTKNVVSNLLRRSQPFISDIENLSVAYGGSVRRSWAAFSEISWWTHCIFLNYRKVLLGYPNVLTSKESNGVRIPLIWLSTEYVRYILHANLNMDVSLLRNWCRVNPQLAKTNIMSMIRKAIRHCFSVILVCYLVGSWRWMKYEAIVD